MPLKRFLIDTKLLAKTREIAALCSECWKDHPMRNVIQPLNNRLTRNYFLVCVNCDRIGR